jgi:hypothetical protein
MQYGRVFPVAMPGELHIPRFCAPQRMDAEIPAAVHIGSARGYHEARDVVDCVAVPARVRRTVGRAVFLYIGHDVGNSLFCRGQGVGLDRYDAGSHVPGVSAEALCA